MSRTLLVRSSAIFRRPKPSLLDAKNIPRCTHTRITTCPSLSFLRVAVDVRSPGRGFTEYKVYCQRLSLCRFEVNVGQVFTASKKRGERGNVFKVFNHRGQLAHLQSELVDPLKERKTDTCGQGVVVTVRREYCSPVNVQSIKIRCVNYCVQRCDIYVPISSACRF